MNIPGWPGAVGSGGGGIRDRGTSIEEFGFGDFSAGTSALGMPAPITYLL